jgi:uncharacterized protein CbrC (UPF0167 family)
MRDGNPVVTFSELGIPFPLFEAPVEEASEYAGPSTCSVCRAKGVHCFHLGVGGDLIAACPGCATERALDADDRADGRCGACGGSVPFPLIEEAEKIRACYACLRAGRAALTKDTELGMVTWELARQGRTHGVPGLQRADFRLVPSGEGSDWMQALVPAETLLELVRTPAWHSWQGEVWRFCCRHPMIYLGTWDAGDFAQRSPSADGGEYFRATVEEPEDWAWRHIDSPDIGGPYMFRCDTCGRISGYWDLS